MPARLRWSSSASAMAPLGLRAAMPPYRLGGVPVRAEQVGTEVADQLVLVGWSRPGRRPASGSRPPASRRWRAPRRTCQSGPPCHGLPGGNSRQLPSMRKCVCRVSPPSNRVSMCLPRETTSSTLAAGQVDRRQRGHPEVADGQRPAGQRRVHPPGGQPDGVALRHRLDGRRLRPAAAGRAVSRGSRPRAAPRRPGSAGPGREHALAVGPLDGELAEHAVVDGERQGVDRRLQHGRVGAEGQQRLAAALDVQRQRAVDEHHQRTGLATGPVPGSRRALARGPSRTTGRPGRRSARSARSGQGSAAPYGLAGSVAASSSARLGSAAAARLRTRSRQPPGTGWPTAKDRQAPDRPRRWARRRRAPTRGAGRPRRAARTARRPAPRRSSRAGSGRCPRTPAAPR